MGFWRTYPNRKDWRGPSRKSAGSCMSGRGCPWCLSGRQHRNRRLELSAREQINEYFQSIGVQYVG